MFYDMHHQIQGSDTNCFHYLLVKQHETDLISSVYPEDKNESLGGSCPRILGRIQILKEYQGTAYGCFFETFEASSSILT